MKSKTIFLPRIAFFLVSALWLLLSGTVIFALLIIGWGSISSHTSTLFEFFREAITLVPFILFFVALGLILSLLIPPFFLPWLVVLPLVFINTRKKENLNVPIYQSFLPVTIGVGYLVSILIFAVMLASCDYYCQTGEPASGGAFIIYMLVVHLWWLPLIAYGEFKLIKMLMKNSGKKAKK